MDPQQVELAEWSQKAVALTTLTQYPEWAIYAEILNRYVTQHLEGYLAGSENPEWVRGYVAGIREAHGLPLTVRSHMDRVRRSKTHAKTLDKGV